MRDQVGPHHGFEALADDRLRRQIDEDGAEQRERNADAAEDEIFPRGLERLVRPVNADHHHRGERGELDRHPHHADIVGHERQVHGEHQHLVHGVVEAQDAGSEVSGLELVADIVRAEHAGGEADKGREHDEDVVEVIDQNVRTWLGTPEEEEGERGEKCEQRRRHV